MTKFPYDEFQILCDKIGWEMSTVRDQRTNSVIRIVIEKPEEETLDV